RHVDVFDQRRPVDRLGEKADGSGMQGANPGALFGDRRNENDRQTAVLAAQQVLELDAAHMGHLNVGNHARRLIDLRRFQELLGRCERVRDISERSHQPARGGPDGRIIVDDRNHGNLRQNCRSWFPTTWSAKAVAEIILRFVCYGLLWRTPSISAILTKSASDLALIFLMMCPRCIFTVISAMPISA